MTPITYEAVTYDEAINLFRDLFAHFHFTGVYPTNGPARAWLSNNGHNGHQDTSLSLMMLMNACATRLAIRHCDEAYDKEMDELYPEKALG